jgi:hypothetical protein
VQLFVTGAAPGRLLCRILKNIRKHGVFGNLFKRKKPRVFLGTLAVAPRVDFKRKIDEWGVFEHEDLDSSLRNFLAGVFTLPSAAEIKNPLDDDLVLDVMIPKFQSGDAMSVDLGDIGFPLFWRPKIEIRSRLYNLKTDKTKMTFSITEKMGWKKYFGRVFSVRGVLRFRPMFDRHDMEHLLYQGCLKLLVKMQNKI